jgi:hypothetical protein
MGYPLNKKPKAALAQITLPTFRNTETFKDNNKIQKKKKHIVKRKWRIFWNVQEYYYYLKWNLQN